MPGTSAAPLSLSAARLNIIKSFLLLFFKKEVLSSLTCHIKLQRRKSGIEPLPSRQARMVASGDDAPGLHNQNAIRAADGGEAVGDDERCAGVGEDGESVLHGAFGFGIE